MLRIIPDEDQVIDKDWVKLYSELPEKTETNEYIGSFISVDLAISLKASADYTAIVILHVYGFKPEDRKYYVDKRFINKRLTHLSTLETVTSLYRSLEGEGCQELRALVESVQYQAAVVEQLEERGIRSKGVKIHTDKRARLQLASSLFEQGKVLFPDDRSIAPIVQQLVGFGVEKHDDLADAMSMGLNYLQAHLVYEVYVSFYGSFDRDTESTKPYHAYKVRFTDEKA